MRIVLALNQVVSALVAVGTPWLHRKRLVEVVFMTVLLVGSLNYALDRIGGGKSPENQSSQKREL